jgi:hypothetical protein
MIPGIVLDLRAVGDQTGRQPQAAGVAGEHVQGAAGVVGGVEPQAA